MNADVVLLDKAEHFEKMTWRNRYRIAGANNAILLSIPLVNGRNQHVPMADICIYNEERWQIQHWRTLVSAYKRSPYFDHYADSLQTLFEQRFEQLTAFNEATVQWVKTVLRLRFELQQTDVYVKDYQNSAIDLRSINDKPSVFPKYYQLFEYRIGFQPDLSILDLLFAEGPGAMKVLAQVKWD